MKRKQMDWKVLSVDDEEGIRKGTLQVERGVGKGTTFTVKLAVEKN